MVLHFPEEIDKNTGIAEIAPQLLRALDPDKVCAVQFLRNGRVRVTCKSTEYRDDLLEGSSFLFGEVPVPVSAADLSIRSVFVRDLPFEVPDRDVQSSFESFGVVHSVHPCFFRDFPSVANGTRRLVMSFRNPIPSSVSVGEYPVRVWYYGQPVVCTICHESGHLPRACPFSSLCLRCKQPGHMAWKCTQPWGPSSTVPVPVPVPSVPVSMPVPSPVPLSAPVVSDVPLEEGEIAGSAVPATVQSTPVPVPAPSSSTSCTLLFCGS